MNDTPSAKEVFADALEYPRDEREGFIARACAGDEAVLAQVRGLLERHDRGRRFMSDATTETPVAPGESPAEAPGRVLGRYTLMERIGEGGFGEVYIAEQREPVQRHVALKIIKPGMDTRQVIARFEAERQALAIMNHPNVATVLDAGATDTGRPYFVMELVRGTPITRYCDEHRLGPRERLHLFAQVCMGVQHAHSKGIIHRDIKPGNVLVTTVDGRPVPKIIDFGIAKATTARLAEKAAFTELRQFVGTPEYMSPEQAQGGAGEDIDTRTDVYSLGVLLYELLTGVTPFDPERLRSAAWVELQRIIGEDTPPKPSTRLSTLKDTLASIAASRHTDPGRLAALVRGDLDWIVMRCLEKDRSRRYPTANSLAEDVQRHLIGEAVQAAPPSAAYRARKYVRRHRLGMTVGAFIAASLVVGLGAAVWQAVAARRDRDRAFAAEHNSTQLANELGQVSEFQAAMLKQIDPRTAGDLLTKGVLARYEAALAASSLPDTERAAQAVAFAAAWNRINSTDTARELIDQAILQPAISAIETEFKDQPEVDARLRQVLAECYHDLGALDAAVPLQEKALAIRRRVLGTDHPQTLDSLHSLALLHHDRGRLAEAESCVREALEGRRRTLGESHKATLTSMHNLGAVLKDEGNLTEAEAVFREVLAKRRVLGEDREDTIISVRYMGDVLMRQGKLAEAEPFLREAVEKGRRVLGEDHRDTLVFVGNLGNLLIAQRKFVEAEAVCREALDKSRRVHGEDHPNTLVYLSTFGSLLQRQGNLADAEPVLREAVTRQRRVLGAEHFNTLVSVFNLARVIDQLGRDAEAEQLFREVVAGSRRALGDQNERTLGYVSVLAIFLRAHGRALEAEPLGREAVTGLVPRLGPDHSTVALARGVLGGALLDLGRRPEAEPELLEAARAFDVAQGASRTGHAQCLKDLAALYESLHAADPGKGFDVRAAVWRARFDALSAKAPSAAPG